MKKNIWRILLAAYILMIFVHSMMPAHISSAESGGLVLLLENMHISVSEHFVRKSVHFMEYAGMGILLRLSLADLRFVGYEKLLFTAMFCMAVPFVDETIQLFAAGRSSQVSDVWLDMAGAAFGVALSCLFGQILPVRRKRGPRWK